MTRDTPAVAAMRELAAQYPRYGYRRIQVFMGRRGHTMSTDRAIVSGGCIGCKCLKRSHGVEWQVLARAPCRQRR